MSLPKINYPLFDVVIPSTGQKVKMRPFLVKEEKLLLMAQTTNNPKDVVNSITQVVNNCLIDQINIDQLTTFDLEYMFIRLRARSVNNKIDIFYKEESDGKQYKIEIDLDKIEISRDPDHVNDIKIGDKMGIVLRYPRTDMMDSMADVQSEVDLYFQVVKYCIEKIYDEDNIYSVSDYSEEELEEFVSSLDVNTFKAIQKFLETMPKLHYEATYVTDGGIERKVVLQNLNDFFMLG